MLRKTRFFALFIAPVLLLASFSYPVCASEELEQRRYAAIKNNCSSIKLQLYKTQKNDSKTRVRIGAYYETMSSKLMMNLNLRLVKNNIAATDLAEQQSELSTLSNKFKEDFIGYSQELESLVAIDCQKDPEHFDEQLSAVRKERGRLSRTVDSLNGIIERHNNSVEELKESLFSSKENGDE